MIGQRIRACAPVRAACALATVSGLAAGASVSPDAGRDRRHRGAPWKRPCRTRRSPSSPCPTKPWNARASRTIADVALFTPNLAINGSRGYGNNQPARSPSAASPAAVAPPANVAWRCTSTTSTCREPTARSSRCSTSSASKCSAGRRARCSAATAQAAPCASSPATPSPQFESYLRATLGNFDRHEISGMVNVPVNDRSRRSRAQGAYLERGRLRQARARRSLSSGRGHRRSSAGRVLVHRRPEGHVRRALQRLEVDGSPQDLETLRSGARHRPGATTRTGSTTHWCAPARPPLATVDDPRLVRNDFTLPDICLLDDFDPDWTRPASSTTTTSTTRVDAKVRLAAERHR